MWVLQRPWSLANDEKAANPDAPCCHPAPPVMEFDAAGNYVQGWGGAGDGLRMARRRARDPRRLTRATSGFRRPAARACATRQENQILKFTQAGKFLLQIGRRGMSKGSLDTANFNNAADIHVYPKTNEVFVADGYVNRRVIVLDADTGAFKRMWGAYGNPPDDAAPNQPNDEGPGAAAVQHSCTASACRTTAWSTWPIGGTTACRCSRSTGSSSARSSSSGRPSCSAPSFSVAFSPDPRQQHLYLADAGNGRVHIFDRRTLEEVGGFGRIGHYAGQFVFLHNVAVDSKGNLYTAEVGSGRRVQKFVRQRSR